MESIELLLMCSIAFLLVFVILALLALLMRLILFLYPLKSKKADAATIAAITTAFQTLFPGTQITQIEEKK